MFLYQINQEFFLHEKEFSNQELQDIVSGMMVNYRKEIVPMHKDIAPFRKENTPDAVAKVRDMEAKIPTMNVFFKRWGFNHIEIQAKAITTYEVLEREE